MKQSQNTIFKDRKLWYELIEYEIVSLLNIECSKLKKINDKDKSIKNGAIILCHNGAKYTADALDTLLTDLEEKGYTIVPVSELIYKENYHMDVTGRQIKN